jgi:hypothetical protein
MLRIIFEIIQCIHSLSMLLFVVNVEFEAIKRIGFERELEDFIFTCKFDI